MIRTAPPRNNWHRVTDPATGREYDHWMCMYWDVELQSSGRWRALFLYRSDRATAALEGRTFATADAAMRAVDVFWAHAAG